jgi:diguanylate cyclase (GGDEF)-like protein/PAS domain S-box-containing protein
VGTVELEDRMAIPGRQVTREDAERFLFDGRLADTVIEAAGCLVVVSDEAGRVLRWNPACARLTGYLPSDVPTVEGLLDRLVPAEETADLRKCFQDLATGRATAVSHVSHWRAADGELHMITWASVRVEAAGRNLVLCMGIPIPDHHALDSALQVSEERYRLLAEAMPDTVYRYRLGDAPGLEYVNPAVSRLLGFPTETLLQNTEAAIQRLISTEVRQQLQDVVGDGGGEIPLLQSWTRSDGVRIWVDHRLTLVRDDDGIPIGVLGIVRDVTDRVIDERLASAQTRILELVARGRPLAQTQDCALEVIETELPDTVALLVEGGLLRARLVAAPSCPEAIAEGCPAPLARQLIRLPEGRPTAVPLEDWDVLPAPLRELAAARSASRLWAMQVMAAEPGRWGYLVVIAPAVGWAERELGVLTTLARLLAIAAERDRAQRALAHQALHDGLTGLANRASALARLEAALDRWPRDRQAVAVLFCDLDRFKNLNDSLGHSAGDVLLVAVAERLRAAAGRDDLVARTGGDEFTVIHDGPADGPGPIALAHRLVAAMEAPFHVFGRRVYASMSVGVAVVGRGATAEALIRDADAAMYRAKERGGHRVEMFDVIMQVRARERLELETGLHAALGRREFSLRYQPQVHLASGRVIGAEALLRWSHGGRAVPPADFIPIAEETGLIVPIGAWVLRSACQVGAQLSRVLPGFGVAVNLSARQLADPQLTEHVGRALAASGLPPGQLCLEVTETTLMDDAPAAMATLKTVHELGVTFAIDDFGTGYSSLLYLKRLPVSALKIDSAFVRGLGVDGDDEAIVASTIQLGHALGRSVIGEGVETVGQHAHLEALGCRLGQGHRFGRADTAEALVERIRSTARFG